MKLGSSVVALSVGAGFGAATSLVNDVSYPYGMIGSQIVDTHLHWGLEVVSKLIGVGWSWAGLAVAMGLLVGTSIRGAVAGVLALLAATTAYSGMDALLLEESLAWLWYELLLWWTMSIVFGPVLGVVGASIRRPGVIGLLAGLTLLVGASVEMILLSSDSLGGSPALNWAQMIVWVAAAVGACVAITRFIVGLRPGSCTGSEQR